LLGLAGFRVLAVTESPAEVVVEIETTAAVAGCGGCGVRAEAQDRMLVKIRDLPCFGRPARLAWRKRRWRCREPLCPMTTWTETSEHVSARAVLTRRAGVEACRQVGENARPVAELADELGVCWWTVMTAVDEHGGHLSRTRTGSATCTRSGWMRPRSCAPRGITRRSNATGLVDLDARILIDLVEGNSA
jgi:transposase